MVNLMERLEALEARYDELQVRLSQPEALADMDTWRRLMKEHADMEELMTAFAEYKTVVSNIEEAKEMLEDADLRDMAKEELAEAEPRRDELEKRMQLLLLHGLVPQLGAQHAHGLLAVLDLRALVLALHHDARGTVPDAHGRVGAVDVLTARAACAVGVDAQIVLVDLHLDVVHLGHDGDGGGGGVDASARFRLGHALHAVRA